MSQKCNARHQNLALALACDVWEEGPISYRQVIIAQLVEVFEEEGIAPPTDFADEKVLLEMGLDSLGFAVFVTKLSDQLGFDPFVESDVPFYPETLGEFVAFYDARKR